MRTVSKSREEKNAKFFQENSQISKLRDERIKSLEAQITGQKSAIKSCLDDGYYQLAKSKINRIIELESQVFQLREKNK